MSLSNAQYNEIMRAYGERQIRAARLRQERTQEVYAQIPGFQELDGEIGALSLSAAEALLRGDRREKEALPKKIRSITTKKRRLLKKAGFSVDYLDPQYECPDCQDTGFRDGQKCQCFRSMQRRLLYRQSKVEGIVAVQNFSHFNLSVFDNREKLSQTGGKTNREYMKMVRGFLETWCGRPDGERGNLILMGNPGTGKTFLMNCITKALLDQGKSVIYLTSTDLFEGFSRSMREEGEDNFPEEVLGTDLLLVDDLGTELANSFTASKFFYVINQRMVFRKSVVISTNLSFRDLKELYSDRVVSRLMADYEIVPLYGKDQRIS